MTNPFSVKLMRVVLFCLLASAAQGDDYAANNGWRFHNFTDPTFPGISIVTPSLESIRRKMQLHRHLTSFSMKKFTKISSLPTETALACHC